jgi:hypothetical protein
MIRSLVFIPVLTIGLAIPAIAADLPKSGSFKIHAGYKVIGEASQIADKHTLVASTAWGVSYNDAGSGPLHMANIVCKSISEVIEGAGTYQSKCAWSESDADKIFTEATGKFTPTSGLAATGTITGGTGKFSGIQGKTAAQCTTLSAMGQASCALQFDYKLALEATGTSTPPATAPSK